MLMLSAPEFLHRHQAVHHWYREVNFFIIKMTEEMHELINNALANKMPCILATASKTGQPNTSFRGSMMVFDDASLAYWDRGKRQSMQDMIDNPKVCVMFRHPDKRIVWPFSAMRPSTTMAQCASRYWHAWYHRARARSRSQGRGGGDSRQQDPLRHR